MTMKTNTREEILEILRDLFVDRDLDNSWGTEEKTDQILALIEKEKKEAYDEGRNDMYFEMHESKVKPDIPEDVI